MRTSLGSAFLSLFLSITSVGVAQVSAISKSALLQHSISALTRSGSVSDMVLSGTARRIAGSDDESGSVTLQAIVSGESRIEMSFASGKHTEIRGNSSKGRMGKWIGPNGVVHNIDVTNLLADDSAWFSPALFLHKLRTTANTTVATSNDATRPCLIVSRHVSNPGPLQAAAKLVEASSEMRIYLDATTSLPATIHYNVHPDNNIQINMPVDVRFSDYRTVDGTQVPFHVEKYLNGGLILDLHLQTAAVNTGVSPASITEQF